MKLLASFALMLSTLGSGFAQVNSKPLVFEVASIKKVAQAESIGRARSTGLGHVTQDPGRIAYTDITLKSLLNRAYKLKPPDQISGPSWLTSERYDVTATIPDGTSPEQIPTMLQNLLTERFRIVMHWETTEQPGYALGVGKSGPKLKESGENQQRSLRFSTTGQIAHAVHNGATMAEFAHSLAVSLHRPVIDSTGLTGKYDITLDVAAEEVFGPRGQVDEVSGDSASAGASIFTAVRELGLTLESRKIPVKQLVIDKADRLPSEN